MPLGAGLITQISALSENANNDYKNGNSHLLHWLTSIASNHKSRFHNIYGKVARGIRHAKSTDDYLDSNNDDEALVSIGKSLIGYSILNSELSSHLGYISPKPHSVIYIPDHNAQRKMVEKTWIWKLSSALFAQTNKENLDNIFNDISIINFNYDRTLKHYLKHAIEEYFNVDASRAEAVVRTLKEYRPYGSVGCLPWESEEDKGVEFGSAVIDPSYSILVNGFPSLYTYTEKQTEAACDIRGMQNDIMDAEIVMFLGMAYHPQNMSILFDGIEGCFAKFYGTTYGLPGMEENMVRRRLLKLRGDPNVVFNPHPVTCSEALTEWGSLFRYSYGRG